MDCFDIKLSLRQQHQEHRQDYTGEVFSHLCMCRSCWTYANYLWHQEAQDIAHTYQLAPEAFEDRLERAWAERNAGRPSLLQSAAVSSAMQTLVLAASGVVFFLL